MSDWTFLPSDEEHTELSLASGRWVVTDGAYFTKDSVEIGHVTASDGFVDLLQTPDGLELLTLGFRLDMPTVERSDSVLVIDSGDMTFCCEDAFRQGGINFTDHRTSYPFLRACNAFVTAARLGGKHCNAVLIFDEGQRCIGLCALPMWGDGAYRLEFAAAGDFQLLRAHLGESC